MSKSLTGAWTGVYFYPADALHNPYDLMPPVGFKARLLEQDSRLSGQTEEPHGPGALGADLEGERSGASMTFVKTPRNGADPIVYSGTVSSDGDRIDGQWTIPGNWSGVFRMQRAEPVVERAVEKQTTA